MSVSPRNRPKQFVLFSVIERWLEGDREQIALWVPVALGAGITAWFLLPGPATWLAWCLACGLLFCVTFLAADGGRIRSVLAGVALLGCAGCLIIWAKASLTGTPPIARPVVATVTGRILSVEALPAQGIARVMLAPREPEGLPGRIRVGIAAGDVPKGLLRNAVVTIRARLMPPAPPAVPGAYDFAQRAYFQGIGATGRAIPPVIVETPGDGRSPLRQRLSEHVREQVAGGAGAIAATLATGDRGAIPEEDAEAMRRSGLAHLLSISGLHVTALIGAVIFLVLRMLALVPALALRWPLMAIAAGAGALAGVGYTLLTGADVPTVRSCIAALLVLAGLALGREAITLRLVAAGALVVLLLWPEALAGPSFQMSFAAVTAIVAVGEHRRLKALTAARDEGALARIARGVLGLFLTGIAVEAVLAPIALFHFHQAGMLGALANLVAIPLTTFVVMPFEALALVLDIVGAGAPAWWVVGQALRLLLAVAYLVAGMPGAVAALPAISTMAFGLTMAGLLWCLLWRSRVRWAGLAPMVIGIVMILMTPKPDILITGDGRHLIVRTNDGGMALLRPRAGDYVRDTLTEAAGYEGTLTDLEALPQARCSRDLCMVDMNTPGGRRRLLATRSFDLVPIEALRRACGEADVVVSERRLPRICHPRWLKVDKATLAGTGGVALYWRGNVIRTVRTPGDRHPWQQRARPPAVARKSPASQL